MMQRFFFAACTPLFLTWLVAWCLALAFAGGPQEQALTGLQGLVTLIFVLCHSVAAYGVRGALVFLLIAFTVAMAMEISSVATGFPFGFYSHVNGTGPMIGGVPVTVGLGYVMLGYLAWRLALPLTRHEAGVARPFSFVTTPLVGAFILAGYDLAFDAIGSTVQGLYAYRHPGGYFGVPVSNFMGWVLTGWLMMQVFALVERRFERGRLIGDQQFWLLPCAIWALTALQYPFKFLQAPPGSVTLGARTFLVADVYETAAICAILTMLPAALMSASRVVGGFLPAAVAPRAGQTKRP